MKEQFIAHYLGAPKKGEEGWLLIEKEREFKTLKEALEVSKDLMKKNRKILQVPIEKMGVRKVIWVNETAIVLWNESQVREEGENGIVTRYQSKEYEKEAKK